MHGLQHYLPCLSGSVAVGAGAIRPGFSLSDWVTWRSRPPLLTTVCISITKGKCILAIATGITAMSPSILVLSFNSTEGQEMPIEGPSREQGQGTLVQGQETWGT